MLWIKSNKGDKERFQKDFFLRLGKVKQKKEKKQSSKKKEQSKRDRIRELYSKGKLLETTYDDDMITQQGYRYLTPEERADYFERKTVRDKILELQLQYLHRTQNTWQSSEDLKAIETAVREEYYAKKKNNDVEK